MVDRNESRLIARELRNRIDSVSDGGDHIKRAARRSGARAATPHDPMRGERAPPKTGEAASTARKGS